MSENTVKLIDREGQVSFPSNVSAPEFKVFIEGVEVPFINISTQEGINTFPTAVLDLHPTRAIGKLRRRATVHIFFKDLVPNNGDLKQQFIDKGYLESSTRQDGFLFSDSEFDSRTAEMLEQDSFKLLFEGFLSSASYTWADGNRTYRIVAKHILSLLSELTISMVDPLGYLGASLSQTSLQGPTIFKNFINPITDDVYGICQFTQGNDSLGTFVRNFIAKFTLGPEDTADSEGQKDLFSELFSGLSINTVTVQRPVWASDQKSYLTQIRDTREAAFGNHTSFGYRASRASLKREPSILEVFSEPSTTLSGIQMPSTYHISALTAGEVGGAFTPAKLYVPRIKIPNGRPEKVFAIYIPSFNLLDNYSVITNAVKPLNNNVGIGIENENAIFSTVDSFPLLLDASLFLKNGTGNFAEELGKEFREKDKNNAKSLATPALQLLVELLEAGTVELVVQKGETKTTYFIRIIAELFFPLLKTTPGLSFKDIQTKVESDKDISIVDFGINHLDSDGTLLGSQTNIFTGTQPFMLGFSRSRFWQRDRKTATFNDTFQLFDVSELPGKTYADTSFATNAATDPESASSILGSVVKRFHIVKSSRVTTYASSLKEIIIPATAVFPEVPVKFPNRVPAILAAIRDSLESIRENGPPTVKPDCGTAEEEPKNTIDIFLDIFQKALGKHFEEYKDGYNHEYMINATRKSIAIDALVDSYVSNIIRAEIEGLFQENLATTIYSKVTRERGSSAQVLKDETVISAISKIYNAPQVDLATFVNRTVELESNKNILVIDNRNKLPTTLGEIEDPSFAHLGQVLFELDGELSVPSFDEEKEEEVTTGCFEEQEIESQNKEAISSFEIFKERSGIFKTHKIFDRIADFSPGARNGPFFKRICQMDFFAKFVGLLQTNLGQQASVAMFIQTFLTNFYYEFVTLGSPMYDWDKQKLRQLIPKPQLLAAVPPKCNVLFPTMIESLTLNKAIDDTPTRIGFTSTTLLAEATLIKSKIGSNDPYGIARRSLTNYYAAFLNEADTEEGLYYTAGELIFRNLADLQKKDAKVKANEEPNYLATPHLGEILDATIKLGNVTVPPLFTTLMEAMSQSVTQSAQSSALWKNIAIGARKTLGKRWGTLVNLLLVNVGPGEIFTFNDDTTASRENLKLCTSCVTVGGLQNSVFCDGDEQEAEMLNFVEVPIDERGTGDNALRPIPCHIFLDREGAVGAPTLRIVPIPPARTSAALRSYLAAIDSDDLKLISTPVSARLAEDPAFDGVSNFDLDREYIKIQQVFKTYNAFAIGMPIAITETGGANALKGTLKFGGVGPTSTNDYSTLAKRDAQSDDERQYYSTAAWLGAEDDGSGVNQSLEIDKFFVRITGSEKSKYNELIEAPTEGAETGWGDFINGYDLEPQSGEGILNNWENYFFNPLSGDESFLISVAQLTEADSEIRSLFSQIKEEEEGTKKAGKLYSSFLAGTWIPVEADIPAVTINQGKSCKDIKYISRGDFIHVVNNQHHIALTSGISKEVNIGGLGIKRLDNAFTSNVPFSVRNSVTPVFPLFDQTGTYDNLVSGDLQPTVSSYKFRVPNHDHFGLWVGLAPTDRTTGDLTVGTNDEFITNPYVFQVGKSFEARTTNVALDINFMRYRHFKGVYVNDTVPKTLQVGSEECLYPFFRTIFPAENHENRITELREGKEGTTDTGRYLNPYATQSWGNGFIEIFRDMNKARSDLKSRTGKIGVVHASGLKFGTAISTNYWRIERDKKRFHKDGTGVFPPYESLNAFVNPVSWRRSKTKIEKAINTSATYAGRRYSSTVFKFQSLKELLALRVTDNTQEVPLGINLQNMSGVTLNNVAYEPYLGVSINGSLATGDITYFNKPRTTNPLEIENLGVETADLLTNGTPYRLLDMGYFNDVEDSYHTRNRIPLEKTRDAVTPSIVAYPPANIPESRRLSFIAMVYPVRVPNPEMLKNPVLRDDPIDHENKLPTGEFSSEDIQPDKPDNSATIDKWIAATALHAAEKRKVKESLEKLPNWALCRLLEIAEGNNLVSDKRVSKETTCLTATRDELIESLVRYEAIRLRFLANSGGVTTVFNPYIVSGYPMAVLGGAINYIGYPLNVNHNISAKGHIRTTVSMGFLRPFSKEKGKVRVPILGRIHPVTDNGYETLFTEPIGTFIDENNIETTNLDIDDRKMPVGDSYLGLFGSSAIADWRDGDDNPLSSSQNILAITPITVADNLAKDNPEFFVPGTTEEHINRMEAEIYSHSLLRLLELTEDISNPENFILDLQKAYQFVHRNICSMIDLTDYYAVRYAHITEGKSTQITQAGFMAEIFGNSADKDYRSFINTLGGARGMRFPTTLFLGIRSNSEPGGGLFSGRIFEVATNNEIFTYDEAYGDATAILAGEGDDFLKTMRSGLIKLLQGQIGKFDFMKSAEKE